MAEGRRDVQPAQVATPDHRPITKPDELIVENVAFGRSKAHVRRAIRDLRQVGLWDRLTRHLYAVKFGSRNGRENVPDDGHLADVYLTARVDGEFGGSFCDVRFYPTAMTDDLDRWATYHAQGLMDAPPSLRQFWGAIMVHELAHCMPGPKGEKAAGEWEERALVRLRGAVP